MISKSIHDLVAQALNQLTISSKKLLVEVPADSSFGDYSTNISLSQAKLLNMNPMELANKIIVLIPQNDLIESVQAIKPGFINFFIKPEKLIDSLRTREADLGSSLVGKKVTVEFTDPNPFKEFHIGHLYSNTIGESLSRLLEAGGAEVHRACYQGDVGIHVACSVWSMLQKASEGLSEIEKLPLTERVKWLGQCYAHGATQYKENPTAQEEIKILNAQIYVAAQNMWKRQKIDFVPKVHYEKLISKEAYPTTTVQEYYEKGRQWTLDYFETLYKRLGTKFKAYYFESYVGELGYEYVMSHVDDGIFEKSDGAIVFKGERFGLHTRVFVNKLGLPTYEAKEMGLNPTKYADQPFDSSLIVTANEIDEYFKVVLKAMSFVSPTVAAKTTHLSHGVVKLPEGKMSSRTGKIISGESLLNEVAVRLTEIMSGNEHIDPDKKEETIQRIATAAIKYAFLRSNFSKDVIFSFEESLSLNGNSGPYLLYTIVRCKSILGKSPSLSELGVKYSDLGSQSLTLDLPLLRLLSKFDDVLAHAISQYAPHLICTYLHALAQEFNAFYDTAPILKADEPVRSLRIQMVRKVADILSQGIHILGFEEVERM